MEPVRPRLTSALAGRYAVEREIGSGGMATVFLADDVKHHRKIAIKVLRPELAAALGAERFLREIEIAAQLSHPNILPLYDSGQAKGLLYYVMPFVEGESLRDRLDREGPLPIADVVRLLRDVADALDYAHRHGVVHRDIKPENVMLAGRHALVTDFGVAKAVSDAAGKTQLTTVGVSIGTPLYMAPEQALADPTMDHRADLYALGVVAYEMLTGHPPFRGSTAQAVLAAHVNQTPPPLADAREGVPARLATLVSRSLAKNPDDRWQSASDVVGELEALVTPTGGVTPVRLDTLVPPRVRRRLAPVLALAVVALVVVSVNRVRHASRVRWAREQAIPLIRQLADSGKPEPAFRLATQAAALLPNDSVLRSLWSRISWMVSIHSSPAGARVLREQYAADDSAWHYFGTTPMDSVRFPFGVSRLRFEKEGAQVLEVAAVFWGLDSPFVLNDGQAVPAGMVRVPGGEMEELNLPGLEHLGSMRLGAYFIDAHETTNRQFKEFVDSGGYRRAEFWDQPSLLNRFTDRTGRPGPATWEAGDYPAGQGDHPVGGVSWFEATAYAKFRGKSLPTIYHWARAAEPQLSAVIVPHSNFGGQAAAAVGTYRGVGPFGTFDMAGNAREWCLNSSGSERYILGGGWNDPTYAFNDAYAQRPLDRSPSNGIRLAKYLPGDTTLAVASGPVVRAYRDFSKERPVSASVFQIYRRLYDYDRTPLHARVEAIDSTAADWVRERISFNAAYGGERVTAYLLVPKHGRPPYQTIVYFPGSNAIHDRSSATSLQVGSFNFIVKSGRAVMYPVYKSTYERGDSLHSDYGDESNFYKEHVIMWAKDLRRSIDYLETRPDIDTKKLGYYGVSWGGYLGGLMPAVEPRIKNVVLLVAGLENQRAQPEVEPINFLPQITVPVLMLNGRYDYYFPVESAQLPFFRFLGTPPQHKRQVISEGGHSVPRAQLITEILNWLDRYFGPAN
jgi:serine/threonine protein kinase/formylglycine-generating enzyme required for sulfatase activity/dienelactone hydrolase